MALGSEENLSQIRTINTFDEIIPIPGIKSKVGDDLIEIAKGYGLNDMHDVLADWIDFGKNMKLTEVKDSAGQVIGYQPELKVGVDFDNVLDIQRKIAAGMLLSFTILVNDKFKVHWDSAYEQEGLFGATWANRYLTIDRGTTPTDTYIDLIKVYQDKLREVQLWHIKQINSLNEGIDLLKTVAKKK